MSTLRFENQQKKTPQPKKQKQAMFFSLLNFQFFVDLFVIAEGFERNAPSPIFTGFILLLTKFVDRFVDLTFDLL